MNHEPDGRPLRADDPLLSEWIDGRLPAAEAAAVARSVAAAPELARVVADLRRIKALLAAAPGREPPAGFVADVLAAVDAPPRLAAGTAAGGLGGPADWRVDAEWERIELERIATEIAEAREDAAVAETTVDPPARWPWMTMLAALAAGMLVAVFVNMPPLHSVLVEKDRDVALRGAGHPQDGLTRSVDEFLADKEHDLAASEVAVDGERAKDPGAAGAGEGPGKVPGAPVAASALKRKMEQSANGLEDLARGLGATTARQSGNERMEKELEYGQAGGPQQPVPAPPARREADLAAEAGRNVLPGELAAAHFDAAEQDKALYRGGKPGALRGALRGEAGGSDAREAKRLPHAADGSGFGGGGGGGSAPALRDRVALVEPLGKHRVATEPVVVAVRGAEGRAEFAALLAARTISVARAEEGRKKAAPETLAQAHRSRPPGGEGKGGMPAEAGPGGLDGVDGDAADGDMARKQNPAKDAAGGDELIALTGSPAAIGDLIASLEGRGLSLGGFSREQEKPDSSGWLANAPRPDLDTKSIVGEAMRSETGKSGDAETAPNARPAAQGASGPADAAVPLTVTLLVRIVDVGPAEPVATSAAAPAAPSAPASGVDKVQGAGDGNRP